MKKNPGDRDPIKEFLQSLAPTQAFSQADLVKCGLPARARPGLSEKTRLGDARRLASGCRAH